MCNLYSITTNQAAIIALFRVINQRYVGNLAPMPGGRRCTDRRHCRCHPDGIVELACALRAAR
jgi:hypothetical protein